MATTVYKGKLVSCYYLRERNEYGPCNDGKSEHLAGIGGGIASMVVNLPILSAKTAPLILTPASWIN